MIAATTTIGACRAHTYTRVSVRMAPKLDTPDEDSPSSTLCMCVYAAEPTIRQIRLARWKMKSEGLLAMRTFASPFRKILGDYIYRCENPIRDSKHQGAFLWVGFKIENFERNSKRFYSIVIMSYSNTSTYISMKFLVVRALGTQSSSSPFPRALL